MSFVFYYCREYILWGPGPGLMASTCMLSVLSKLSLLQLYTRLLFLQFHFVFILGRTLNSAPMHQAMGIFDPFGN